MAKPPIVSAVQGTNTVLANPTNAMTVFNSAEHLVKDSDEASYRQDMVLGLANMGVGVGSTVELVTTSPETGKSMLSVGATRWLGMAGVTVGGLSVYKDYRDIQTSYDGDWKNTPANEIFSITGNSLATISAYATTTAATSAAASASVVTSPVTVPTAAGSITVAAITGGFSVVFNYLANITPDDVTIGDIGNNVSNATTSFANSVIGFAEDIINGVANGIGRTTANALGRMHGDVRIWQKEVSQNVEQTFKKEIRDLAEKHGLPREKTEELIDKFSEAYWAVWDKLGEVFERYQDFQMDIFDVTIYDWLPDTFKTWFDLNRDGTHTVYDPLILDLDGNGISTVAIDHKTFQNNAFFDFNGDGVSHATGWTTTDGILVRDVNGDGVINNGREVFGDSTIKQDGTTAKHGFDALADLDSNADGVISKLDALFHELKVWQDKNKDGISQADELKTNVSLPSSPCATPLSMIIVSLPVPPWTWFSMICT